MLCLFYLVFLSFCPLERFLYSVHEYSDIIYSLGKGHLGSMCLLFHRVEEKKIKETRLENISSLYKDIAVID